MTGKKGMKRYSIEVKLEAVRLYFEEEKTQRWIADWLGVSDVKRIERWVHDYRREGAAAFSKPVGRPRKQVDEASELARLRMENDLLKKYRTELCKMQLVKRNIGSSTHSARSIR
jgi:transposase-like protein